MGGGRATRPKSTAARTVPRGEVVRKNCVACHGIDDYAFYSQDRPAWQKLIADKHKPGEADLSTADRDILLDYLVAKFGPDTKPLSANLHSAGDAAHFSPTPEASKADDPGVHQFCSRH